MKENALDRINDKLTFLTSLSNKDVEETYHYVDNFVKSNYLFEGEDEEYVIKYKDKMLIVGYF